MKPSFHYLVEVSDRERGFYDDEPCYAPDGWGQLVHVTAPSSQQARHLASKASNHYMGKTRCHSYCDKHGDPATHKIMAQYSIAKIIDRNWRIK